MRKLVTFSSILILLVGCSVERQTEDYNLEPAASLTQFQLTADTHPHGYTRSECFACHLPQNIHRIDRTGIGDANLGLIRGTVENGGLATCQGCHGTNGVTP